MVHQLFNEMVCQSTNLYSICISVHPNNMNKYFVEFRKTNKSPICMHLTPIEILNLLNTYQLQSHPLYNKFIESEYTIHPNPSSDAIE